MERDEGAPLSASAEAVLAAIQRSVDAVQDFLERTGRQAAVIGSLEAELGRARDHAKALESESARLRSELVSKRPLSPQEIEALIEEQNVLAHMFVASDRLARARTPREALDIGVEVLHNLAGVHRYGVWLRGDAGATARLVGPTERRFRITESQGDLVERALATKQTARVGNDPGQLPVAVPLVLDGQAVGAIEIRELVPQVGDRLGRLQDELLQFLSDRLAPAMCQAALSASHILVEVWTRHADQIATVQP
jgi:hypothetical protein